MVLTNGLKKPISISWRTTTIPWEEKVEVATDREKFMWRLQETFSVAINPLLPSHPYSSKLT